MRRGFLVVVALFLVGGLICPAAVPAQEIIRGTKKVTPQPAAQPQPQAQPEPQPEAQPGTPPPPPPHRHERIL
jgi:hypothetical protein